MKTSVDELIELYSKRLAGVPLSPQEEKILQAWEAMHPVDDAMGKRDLEAMLRFERQKHKAWANILPMDKRTRNSKPVWWIAAALLAAVIGLLVMWDLQPDKPAPAALAVVPARPEQDSLATVELNNRSVITLSKRSKGLIAEQGSLQLTVPQAGHLQYVSAGTYRPLPIHPGYNTIEVRPGANLAVLLPDGSQVWLNAASELRFPLVFGGGERRVELRGEAYFDVKKDASKPFIVQTQDDEIVVTGTSFNVRSYGDQPGTVVTLATGSLTVRTSHDTLSLSPGEQAIVNSKKIKKAEAPAVEAALAWKHGYFQYTNSDLKTIIEDVRRWFMLEEVDYQGSNQEARFVIEQIPRAWPLESVLNVLQKTGDFRFQLEGKKLTVFE